MTKYECLCCMFFTNHKGNYIKHINTTKHRINETEYIKENGFVSNEKKEQKCNHKEQNKQYNCRFCPKSYKYRQNRYRHEQSCKYKDNPQPQQFQQMIIF